ncbi:MAG TPA: hypothetical protein VNR66_12195 [Solirubrobacteraceae bacterium]|nr:hypothetical protein [Solirubrobacteraceae bacterium]
MPANEARRAVVRRRRGADRHRVLVAGAELGECLPDGVAQPLRNLCPGDDLLRAHRGRLERGRVVHVDRAEQLVQAAAHAGLLTELRIRGRADDEAGRNGHAGAHQLTEIRALAAGVARIAAAQRVQRPHADD